MKTLKKCLRHDATQKAAPWLMVLAWMVLIHSFSRAPGEESAALSGDVAFFVYRALDTIAPRLIEGLHIQTLHAFLRSAAHFTLYFFLGIWLLDAMRPFFPYTMASVNAVLVAFIYAIFDEMYQYFVPNRVMSVYDIYIDTAGALTGVLLIGGLVKLREYREKREEKNQSEQNEPTQ